MVTVCPSQFATRRTLFHVLVGCGLLMLKVSRLKLPVIWLLVSMWLNTLRSEERFSRNAETDLVCRLLLEKKKKKKKESRRDRNTQRSEHSTKARQRRALRPSATHETHREKNDDT